MKRLFIVMDVIEIKERGTFVLGRLDDPDSARYYVGDPVEIRRRDGSVVRTTISEIAFGSIRCDLREVLLNSISASDVKAGDEIWIESPRNLVD